MTSTPVYISIGSNVDREMNIRSSIETLEAEFGKCVRSSVYESPAVGFEGDDFYNLVVRVDTERSVEDVDATLTEIEDRHGRDRSGPRFSPRTLDLDLLLYGDLISNENGLELPRGEITRYAFVLKPLAEVAPENIHPTNHTTYAELWRAFETKEQPIWTVDFNWNQT